jgi:hypothetical protein
MILQFSGFAELLEPTKYKLFASNLNNIHEFVIDTTTETETIMVALRAIRNLASSSINERILFNGKLIPKLTGKLVSNPNPALNHHLVITLYKIFSLLRSLSKDVINSPHEEGSFHRKRINFCAADHRFG